MSLENPVNIDSDQLKNSLAPWSQKLSNLVKSIREKIFFSGENLPNGKEVALQLFGKGLGELDAQFLLDSQFLNLSKEEETFLKESFRELCRTWRRGLEQEFELDESNAIPSK